MKAHNIFVLEDMTPRILVFSLLSPPHSLKIAEDAPSAIAFLKEHGPLIEVVFLDHDLAQRVFVSSDDKNTGAEVARFMVSDDCTLSRSVSIIVHSLNPIGADNIMNVLDGQYPNLHRIPYDLVRARILEGSMFSNG